MKRFTVRLAMAAMVLSLWIGQTGTGAARADLVYIVAHDATMHFGSGDVFGRLDVGTGAFDQISTLTTPGHTITGMGFGTDGQIYGFGFGFVNGTPSTDLYRIDPATGSATDLGAVGFNPVGAASGSSGVLFGIDGFTNQFFSDTPPSTTTTLISSLAFSGDGLVAIGPDGNLYATGNGDGSFFRVDTSNGATTLVGNTGHGDLYAGSFVGSTLYGFAANTKAIVTIDTSTGATASVATAA
jgi:hypothetical protein